MADWLLLNHVDGHEVVIKAEWIISFCPRYKDPGTIIFMSEEKCEMVKQDITSICEGLMSEEKVFHCELPPEEKTIKLVKTEDPIGV